MTKEELESMLDTYYEPRGWDRKTGVPTHQKLEELDLQRAAEEIESKGQMHNGAL